jgi:hypothetical protein
MLEPSNYNPEALEFIRAYTGDDYYEQYTSSNNDLEELYTIVVQNVLASDLDDMGVVIPQSMIPDNPAIKELRDRHYQEGDSYTYIPDLYAQTAATLPGDMMKLIMSNSDFETIYTFYMTGSKSLRHEMNDRLFINTLRHRFNIHRPANSFEQLVEEHDLVRSSPRCKLHTSECRSLAVLDGDLESYAKHFKLNAVPYDIDLIFEEDGDNYELAEKIYNFAVSKGFKDMNNKYRYMINLEKYAQGVIDMSELGPIDETAYIVLKARFKKALLEGDDDTVHSMYLYHEIDMNDSESLIIRYGDIRLVDKYFPQMSGLGRYISQLHKRKDGGFLIRKYIDAVFEAIKQDPTGHKFKTGVIVLLEYAIVDWDQDMIDYIMPLIDYMQPLGIMTIVGIRMAAIEAGNLELLKYFSTGEFSGKSSFPVPSPKYQDIRDYISSL